MADEIQKSQDKLAELDSLLNDKDLKDLKEKTQGIEDEIRHLNTNLMNVNSEIQSFENTIKFNEQLITSKQDDIKNTLKNNESLEKDQETCKAEIVQLEEQLNILSDKIAVIDEKLVNL